MKESSEHYWDVTEQLKPHCRLVVRDQKAVCCPYSDKSALLWLRDMQLYNMGQMVLMINDEEVCCTVASQHEGAGFKSRSCLEFTCSPSRRGFSPGSPISSHSSKTSDLCK